MWASCDTLDSICIVCKHLRLDRQEWWAHCVCQISDVMRRGTHIMWGLIGRAYMGWYPQEESKHNPPEGLIGVKNTLILWQRTLCQSVTVGRYHGYILLPWMHTEFSTSSTISEIMFYLDPNWGRRKKSWRKPQVWVTDPCAHFRVCCCARVVRINYKR